jgi:Rps23 Pro-64 3,4-dihydroxylase Tpa1-like proline 4-hydroxylase
MRQMLCENVQLWETYRYYAVSKARFSCAECTTIINLHQHNRLVSGKMSTIEGRSLRDSDIFWIPRREDTDWIFSRLWEMVGQYNRPYGFELAQEMGQAQLTRYRPGQHYEWHMDLGSGQPSLRKITAVLELTSKETRQGGGIDIFHGQSVGNKVDMDLGDVVLFPSFVMHRASVVERGTRWSLVLWLNGTKPFA